MSYFYIFATSQITLLQNNVSVVVFFNPNISFGKFHDIKSQFFYIKLQKLKIFVIFISTFSSKNHSELNNIEYGLQNVFIVIFSRQDQFRFHSMQISRQNQK